MKLIESEEQREAEEPEEKESAVPAEDEPQEADRDTSGGESRWPIYAALILVVAGLIVGLIFLARWIYHETKHKSGSNKPATAQSQSKKSPSSSASNGVISLGGGQEPDNKASHKPSSSSKTKTKSLPNNGPGNVIGVFAVASFAAGALHYIASLRKTARQNR